MKVSPIAGFVILAISVFVGWRSFSGSCRVIHQIWFNSAAESGRKEWA